MAEKEGFGEIATMYRMIARVEQQHENRYLALAESIEKGAVLKKQTPVRWKCRKCGYILRGIPEPRCSECGERI